ncbi:MarR family transcriptional regulator [Actinomycetes bacterium KLBMP 9797]
MADRDEEAVRRYVEHLAATLYEMGFPRMPARVLCALLASDEGAMTAGELGEWLGVSPAAISGAVRYLTPIGMVRREREPGSRSDRYRVLSTDRLLESVVKSGVYRRAADVVAEGVPVMGADTAAGARMAEMADFFYFVNDEYLTLIDKWRAHRAPS